jgi:hypothetical protein
MRRAGLVLAAAALLIGGACGTGEDPGLAGQPPADTSTPGIAANPDVHTVEIRVVDGKPAGGVKREDVEKGETVRIVVFSDVADEVHIHGYDRSFPVRAGGEASGTFIANVTGIFEVELEQRKEKILELEVK